MKDNRNIHFSYIIAIMAFIIIGLISVKWSEVPRLTEYISFALTVSSLLLATLAIAYAFYSGENLSLTLQKISESSTEIKYAAQNINTLTNEIKEIPDSIKKVTSKVDSSNKLLENLSKEKMLGDDTTHTIKTESSDQTVATLTSDTQAISFLNNSPPRGCEALLIAILGYKERTSFELSDISQGNSYMYLLSYLLATKAAGLIDFEYDALRRIAVTNAHPALVEEVENYVIENNERTIKDLSMPGESEESNRVMVYSDYFNIFGYFNSMHKAKIQP
ncbi:hypothetical protein [Billgrantia kenyensis]|uniref:Uncharacterized protein n=1 Tax=Billgrantia kenyensis TaxID=321266 RepID=A0A7W0AEE1_9GAMM|nr:hypothetical protein [Halomonas kenyensis]MBA2779544.1 hypothetical protein [Halomonas kenyensis]MCG6662256.1 hypothetical protein [Halomonas kenyensis]